MKTNFLIILITAFLVNTDLAAQEEIVDSTENIDNAEVKDSTESTVFVESNFSGLKFRSIGPAFASGRIADIAVHPENENIWYVAVGSGGVWKTENSGTTWKPLFDSQSCYSTGCVTIDPNNPHTIWVGTGENVGGRHVGFGDGIYKSEDDGASWKNVGLEKSEHISKIIVHPDHSEIIWVAVQGPLWKKGGERGLYKSIDGGVTWKQTLGDDEWVGVTDVVMDPRNPDWMYAATWQRHRTVAAYMGGGPGSGIHRSTDGGETWQKLKKGIPGSNLGKIGLAISPFNPDIIYAAIELDRKKGGVFMSSNRGISWEKQSDAVSGATGPHYYQELYASPHSEGRLYLMDVRIQVSDDHGKTFRRLSERDKHSDNHSIYFRPDDPDYLLVGTDAGIYESFDLAETWRFIDNLPLTQYYKLAVDDSEPFYNVYGGTQDNGSHGGPSRTDNSHGIRNEDWFKTLGADGHQSAVEPGNPNITYAESQRGGLHRIDHLTGEQVFIQPQSKEGEPYERFNWDAPILVSPHSPSRLYFASYRVWRSDNRGDSWTTVSEDLTRGQERIELPIMGKKQSWDNPWDLAAMSDFSTITSLAESPLQEGLLYAGTDDGLLNVSEDGGANWRRIELGRIQGIPSTSFVNDVRADLYDSTTVYVALDNHKYGDFKPYLLKSTDAGRTWTSISSNIPDRNLVWRVVQDHIKPNLLFAATEFGIYFTVDGGKHWVKLKSGLPTISFRDITIQRRESDLVAASFGRGFYILDDYSPLRYITEENAKLGFALFPIKDALWYRPRNIASQQGSSYFSTPNPSFGAVFTYFLTEKITTLKAERKKKEKKLMKENRDISFPGWDAIELEKEQESPKIIFTITDKDGNLINTIEGKAGTGMQRVAWNLRKASKNGIRIGSNFNRGGSMVTPGEYKVVMSKIVEGATTQIAGPLSFNVKPLRSGALQGASYDEIIAFSEMLTDFQQDITATNTELQNCEKRLAAMKIAAGKTTKPEPGIVSQIYDASQKIKKLDLDINGYDAKNEVGARNRPSPNSRMFVGFRGLNTTYGPTAMHKETVETGKSELAKAKTGIAELSNSVLPEIEKALKEAGAPWIEGQGLIDSNGN
jgi:photosystem II stability/assembly factor-like uncharacterized protein